MLTPEQMEEAVEAMARAYPYWPIETTDSQDAIREYCRAALTVALPVIERAVLAQCMNEAAAIAYKQEADHGAANTGGADEVLKRLQALAGEER